MTDLVLVSASDEEALVLEMKRLIAFIDRVPDASLDDIAYTCSLAKGDSVVAIIASSASSLRAKLLSAVGRIGSVAGRIKDRSGVYYFRKRLLGPGGGKLAFVYPGVMSFYPDMLRDLAIAHPECRDVFDELEEAVKGNGDFVPSSFIFPPAPYYRHDADIFKSGAYAQALVSTYAACAALTRMLSSSGLVPDGVVGFAGGDLAAMMLSGAVGDKLSRPDRVGIVRDIYGIVAKAVNHGGLPAVAMVSILVRHPGEIDDLVKTFPPDKVALVVDYSPRQKTYAVSSDYEKTVLDAFAAAGVRAVKLALDKPFNTPLCESLVPVVRKFAKTWMKHKPVREVYSCATASRVSDGLRPLREDTAARWARPIRFEETVRRMFDDGYRVFVEVGPRALSSAAICDTLRGEDFAAIATNSIHRTGLLQAQHAIGQLVALGAKMDISSALLRRGAKKIDFDAAISMEVRRDSEMRLSRSFPRLTLLSGESLLSGRSVPGEPKGRGARAAQRAAAVAYMARRQRQFDFGAMNPMISDADTVSSSPGVSVEISKVFKISDMPFIGDYALGTSQLSYSDPNLKGLVLLAIPVGIEIMAETAGLVAPKLSLVRISDFSCRRMVSFEKGELRLSVRAERVASGAPHDISVKVLLRDSAPESEYTWPVMEAVFVLSDTPPRALPATPDPLMKPRSVHWSGRDIYSSRLSFGRRLRGIEFVEQWSETGIDYDVTVPPLAGNFVFTRFPIWVVNPLLMEIVVSGFSLWRSHERFAGAFAFPFRMRRMDFRGSVPNEGSTLKCYLRLTGVTPKSHLCDITVTDGNGTEVMSISGWEELSERVPSEYRELVMQPANAFLTESLLPETLGDPATDVASAFITDVPYQLFERSEELWLRVFSRIVLSAPERRDFFGMTGSTARRTEWLFGRIVAKEAVRRYMKECYQARWSDADVQIWADDSGKPHALGDWSEFLTTKLDIAIAHTAQFVVAVVAANARVGVDVESVSRDLSSEFAAGVFTPDEMELAAQAANASKALIRFWCAKEAVSKALGTGIRYSPKELVVTSYQPDSGALTVQLEGAWLEPFKAFKGRDISVTVKTIRDHALASCFIPASFFGEG